MSISTVITRGFGHFGGVNFLPTIGYSIFLPPPMPPNRIFRPGLQQNRFTAMDTRTFVATKKNRFTVTED